MKLKYGEYVRTKNQGIFIIIHINPDMVVNDFNRVCLGQNEKVAFGSIEEIKKLKHSKNIIDLIEVGDYVNGHLVIEILRGDISVIIYDYGETQLFEKDIKSIVTKEQYSSIEYRLED